MRAEQAGAEQAGDAGSRARPARLVDEDHVARLVLALDAADPGVASIVITLARALREELGRVPQLLAQRPADGPKRRLLAMAVLEVALAHVLDHVVGLALADGLLEAAEVGRAVRPGKDPSRVVLLALARRGLPSIACGVMVGHDAHDGGIGGGKKPGDGVRIGVALV